MSREPTLPQREAIEAGRGPVLVIAGPGAGKTFCITGRVRHHILEHGIPPERILAVTFTNKAAAEITHRLEGQVAGLGSGIGGTLHSLCLRLLREFPEPAGLRPGFAVADDEYQRALLRSLGAKEQAVGDYLRAFGVARHDPGALSPGLENAYQRYRSALRRRNLLDFDDLIFETSTLMETREDVASEVAARWDAILVDEFQDLTPTHYAILSRLARGHRTIFAVGDDEQSIYGFTGAAPGILQRFQREFSVTPILLDLNHRNSEAIFSAARAVLRPDTPLFEKPLRATTAGGTRPSLHEFETEREETGWLVEDLLRDREASGLPWGEYAILTRANWVLETLEGPLLGAGIPFRTGRGRALVEDPVVGPLLAALRLIQNPADPVPVRMLTRAFLPREVQEQLKALESGGGRRPVAALAAFAARKDQAAEQDIRRVRRLYYHIMNLPALARSVKTLDELADLIVKDRPSSRPSAFEERADELTDPAELPGARQLAEDLTRARHEGRRVAVVPWLGIEVAVAGMLRAAGLDRLLRNMGEPGGGARMTWCSTFRTRPACRSGFSRHYSC